MLNFLIFWAGCSAIYYDPIITRRDLFPLHFTWRF